VLHLAAVSWHTWGLKERLIEAMFHGKKHLDGDADGQEITEHRAVAALFFLIFVALVVTALVYFAPVPSLDDFY
jgi:hypothetical protein